MANRKRIKLWEQLRKVGMEEGGAMSIEKSPVIIGDPSQLHYPVAAVYVTSELDKYVTGTTGRSSPFTLQERFISGTEDINDFDTYIPGLLVAAIVMVMLSVSIAISRDIENGTARRLVLSRMTSFDLLGGCQHRLSHIQPGIGSAGFRRGYSAGLQL